MTILTGRRLASLGLAACAAVFSSHLAAAPAELKLYAGRPLDSFHVTIADPEAQARLQGDATTVPKPAQPQSATSSVSVRVSPKDSPTDALTMQWKDAWYTSLRIEGGNPVDLRPFIAQGVLALDLNVSELAKGGINFRVDCGANCERKVSYVIPARKLAGQGWQRVVLAMSCFVQDGDDFSAVTQPFALEGTGAGEVAVANVSFQQSGTPNASCPDYRTASVTPDMLNESWAIDWWLPRHEAKLAEIKKSPHPEIVFIGDSITQGWEKEGAKVWARYFKKYRALNLGYGGDRTENVLWRLQHGEVDGIHPKVAVLMIGTNNTGHRHEDPQLTVAGIKRILQELRQRLPKTKILMFAIFPRDEKADGAARLHNEKINAMLPALADEKTIYFRNINKAFLDADGVLSRDIMPDLLHPNEKGYETWAVRTEAELRTLMQQTTRRQKQ